MPDDYTTRARLAPAGLAAIPPAALFVGGVLSADQVESIAAIAFGGVGCLVAAFTRERGRRLQDGLFSASGGAPTLRRLRWKDTEDPAAMARRHKRIEKAVGEALPTPDEETADPGDADHRYNEAISTLRERTRNKESPVFDENQEYGFRRNCLGIRPFALLIAGVVLVVSLVLLVVSGTETRFWIGAALGAVALPAWGFVVKPNWVRAAADRYADALIAAGEALPRPESTPRIAQPTAGRAAGSRAGRGGCTWRARMRAGAERYSWGDRVSAAPSSRSRSRGLARPTLARSTVTCSRSEPRRGEAPYAGAGRPCRHGTTPA